jgi:hypothetical protein
VALVLQGGGALGAYQGGVYQALAEAGLHPDWVAGISIGAVNAALIAGNPPEKRVERLMSREKEIQFSSRTRAATNIICSRQKLGSVLAQLLDRLPADLKTGPEMRLIADAADLNVYNIIQLIYRAKSFEGQSKDYEFSRQQRLPGGARARALMSAGTTRCAVRNDPVRPAASKAHSESGVRFGAIPG